jgi:hypothetical protein
LKKNCVFKEVIEQVYVQMFYFINSHTILALVDPGAKRCKVGSALIIKLCIAQLEMWADSHHLVRCHKELKPLREATAVILIYKKASLVDRETIDEVAPSLSINQVRKIMQLYQPDEYDPNTIPSAVLKALTVHMKKENIASQQIEFDERIVYKPSCSMVEEIPHWKKVKAPQELLSQEGLQFLKK